MLRIMMSYNAGKMVEELAKRILALLVISGDRFEMHVEDMVEVLEWLKKDAILMSPNVARIAFYEIDERDSKYYESSLLYVIEFCQIFNFGLFIAGNENLKVEYNCLEILQSMVANREHQYDGYKQDLFNKLSKLAGDPDDLVEEGINVFEYFAADPECLTHRENTPTDITDPLTALVESLNLSVRTSNCLRNAKIKTIGELISKTKAEMLEINNLGRKSFYELKEILEDKGLFFKDKSILDIQIVDPSNMERYKKEAYSVLVEERSVTDVAIEAGVSGTTIRKHIIRFCTSINKKLFWSLSNWNIATIAEYNSTWFANKTKD